MDATTAKWFDDNSVSVFRSPDMQGFMQDVQIARITGAPRNSQVHIAADEDAIEFRIVNNIFAEPMYRYLIQRADGSFRFYLKNAVMVLAEKYTNEGIGTRSVIREIFEAAAWANDGIHITHIEVYAAGDYAHFLSPRLPLRGYYVWPMLGFDADIPQAVHAKLRGKSTKCCKISELIATESGRDDWLLNGQSVNLAFDLALGSTSWRQLLSYMKDKGIEP